MLSANGSIGVESVVEVGAEVPDEVFSPVTVGVEVGKEVVAWKDRVLADGKDDWQATLLDLVDKGTDGGVP